MSDPQHSQYSISQQYACGQACQTEARNIRDNCGVYCADCTGCTIYCSHLLFFSQEYDTNTLSATATPRLCFCQGKGCTCKFLLLVLQRVAAVRWWIICNLECHPAVHIRRCSVQLTVMLAGSHVGRAAEQLTSRREALTPGLHWTRWRHIHHVDPRRFPSESFWSRLTWLGLTPQDQRQPHDRRLLSVGLVSWSHLADTTGSESGL